MFKHQSCSVSASIHYGYHTIFKLLLFFFIFPHSIEEMLLVQFYYYDWMFLLLSFLISAHTIYILKIGLIIKSLCLSLKWQTNFANFIKISLHFTCWTPISSMYVKPYWMCSAIYLHFAAFYIFVHFHLTFSLQRHLIQLYMTHHYQQVFMSKVQII